MIEAYAGGSADELVDEAELLLRVESTLCFDVDREGAVVELEGGGDTPGEHVFVVAEGEAARPATYRFSNVGNDDAPPKSTVCWSQVRMWGQVPANSHEGAHGLFEAGAAADVAAVGEDERLGSATGDEEVGDEV